MTQGPWQKPIVTIGLDEYQYLRAKVDQDTTHKIEELQYVTIVLMMSTRSNPSRYTPEEFIHSYGVTVGIRTDGKKLDYNIDRTKVPSSLRWW